MAIVALGTTATAAVLVGESIAAGGAVGAAVGGAASAVAGGAAATAVTAATGCAVTGAAVGGAVGGVAASAGFWTGVGAVLTGPVGVAVLIGAVAVTGGAAQEIDGGNSDLLEDFNQDQFDVASNDLDASVDFFS